MEFELKSAEHSVLDHSSVLEPRFLLLPPVSQARHFQSHCLCLSWGLIEPGAAIAWSAEA